MIEIAMIFKVLAYIVITVGIILLLLQVFFDMLYEKQYKKSVKLNSDKPGLKK